jgi:hypothetical protein
MKRYLIAVTLTLFAVSAARGQVPGIINYQGRVSVAGTNFDGTGQFQFALVNNGASQTYWSNGNSAVSLTVTKGLYSVLLGDTGIGNMSTAILASVFTNSDVRLRVWFNDGVSGLQQLSPDQRLGAVGYAMSVPYLKVFALENTAVGNSALPANATGFENTACGDHALFSNTSGSQNTATGYGALYSNTNGNGNTAYGYAALNYNTSGYDNTANGANALGRNTTGADNTADGFQALLYNTTGTGNTADGFQALYANTTGNGNTANGSQALYCNTNGFYDTANGVGALYANRTGYYNTANGALALYNNTSGNYNTANGVYALYNSTNGNYNIALGYHAGYNLTTGDNNIDIGNQGAAGEANTIRIGVQGTQTNTYIAGISGVTISPSGGAVYINSAGQLGTVNSSRRFKEAIQDMGNQSDVLLSLRPVAFRYKPEYDPLGAAQFGLIAEEVEKAAPELVLRDAKGAVYSVRYEQVNAMLLNEFLKQHRRVQVQDRVISELETRLAELEARMQKLSDIGGK